MKQLTELPTAEQQWQTITHWLGAGSINIFGLPFAGKDTQGAILAQQLNAPVIGGGDIMRSDAAVSAAGREAVNSGGMAPQEEFLQIVTPYLSQERLAGKPLVLSSLGRWDGEQQVIFAAADEAGHPIQAAILLTIGPDTMRDRWQTSQADGSRGDRADDEEHKLDVRMREFTDKTQPVLDFYRDKGLLIEVAGMGDVEAVAAAVREQLFARATAQH